MRYQRSAAKTISASLCRGRSETGANLLALRLLVTEEGIFFGLRFSYSRGLPQAGLIPLVSLPGDPFYEIC